jgi:hypothetical protein
MSRRRACASMSVLDIQASKDFTADWAALRKKHAAGPYEAKAKEA